MMNLGGVVAVIPIVLALGALLTGIVYWLMCQRRCRDTDLDITAFLLVGVAWMVIALVFQQANLGWFGSVLVIGGMALAIYRQLEPSHRRQR